MRKTKPVICALILFAMLAAFFIDFHSNVFNDITRVGLTRFNSYEELKDFVTRPYIDYDNTETGTPTFTNSAIDKFSLRELSSVDYSGTNIQVAGVDEADVVKTDGEYIYLLSDNSVVIVKAYPPEDAEVVSKTCINGTLYNMFIGGDRLILFLSRSNWDLQQTIISIYDVADRSNPVFERDVTIDGQYMDSRMIDGYVYIVASNPIFKASDKVTLPTIQSGEKVWQVSATDVYHSELADYAYAFTVVAAINIEEPSEKPTYETILMGTMNSVMYVSPGNIYIAMNHAEKTAVYRVKIKEGIIEYAACGEVPGQVLNQFSMDEYEDHLRIATTVGWLGPSGVYVLDMNLDVVGSVEDLALGERIYSARFMGGRCYLVTFKKVDPLFVIDLRQPETPTVLGYLKVTGYSDYLHPYDENHLIGVGKETVAAEEGDFAWYQGVKISLFDVSNVEEPVEIAKFEIGNRGTESPVLWDHKAFLFSSSRNLLAIPVSVAEIAKTGGSDLYPWSYGWPVWNGVYVFHVSLEDGLVLRDRITHNDNGELDADKAIYRSLYIGDAFYTVSNAKLAIHSLYDLSLITELCLEVTCT